jgi:murein hydrolase activator
MNENKRPAYNITSDQKKVVNGFFPAFLNNKQRIHYSLSLMFLIFLSLHNPVPVMAQKSKNQLEQEKRENLQKIKEAEKILKETETQKTSTLGQLNAINRQIEVREGLIKSISKEINLLENEIGEIGTLIMAMEDDLVKLKKEYASMIYAANKARNSHDKLTFLFSSHTFHQLIMRLHYMQQYGDARKTQVEQIEKVKVALSRQRQNVEVKRIEKDKLLKDQIVENQSLIALKNKQSEIIKELSIREKDLRTEVTKRKTALDNLERAITEIIKKEIELAAKEKASGKPKSAVESTVLSSTFEGLKKKMIWPVSTGFISGKFGTQPHPVLKGIFIENTGVDIQTNKNETVKSVYDGKVSVVASIRGLNGLVVIIQHGDYRTVYANLSKAFVKTGQEVKAREVIGEVYTDKDGISELRFEIWKNYEKLDPSAWLGIK